MTFLVFETVQQCDVSQHNFVLNRSYNADGTTY